MSKENIKDIAPTKLRNLSDDVLQSAEEAVKATHDKADQLFNRPLKKWASNASGTLFSKKRVAQTRLRSDCTGQSGLFAGHLAHVGRTYPRAHA